MAAGADTPRLGDDWMVEAMRVPRSTTNLPRNRRIPFVNVGRRTLFEPDSPQDWIAAHPVQPR